VAVGMSVGSGSVTQRPAVVVVAEARELVEPVYREVVGALPPEVRRVVGYHVGWWDAEGRPTGQAGKAVRPALTLACARAAGLELTPDRRAGRESRAAVRAAVAVELVHDFSLLHDDVVDEDVTRRHRPTAWTVFGAGPAILVGDVLLTMAVQQVDHGAGAEVLAAAAQELCVGQVADLAFEQREDVSLAECVAMAEGKTAALLGAACELGAWAAGVGSETAGLYRRFGREVGMAFQLVDDLLGIWGSEQTTGKPVGSDLASRKKTLPVVAALTSGTDAGERLAALYARHAGRGRAQGEGDLAELADLVEAAGGRAWARAQAERHIGAAMAALTRADPNPAGAADLRALAELITRREH
jgi:geranylgeranyl diphosphate synthase, type I